MFGTGFDIRALSAQQSSKLPTFAAEKHVGITDADELEAIVARVLRPHRLEFSAGSTALDATVFTLKGRGVNVLIHQYGKDVYIEPMGIGKFLLVDMPLTGTARYGIGSDEILGDERHAVVLPSDRPIRLNFDKGLQQIIVRIEWDRVETACERYFGVSGVTSPSFEPRLDLSTPGGIAWQSAVYQLIGFSQLVDGFLCTEEYASQIEDLMIGALLLAHPNNFSARLTRSMNLRNAVVPRYVKRAMEYLHAHATEPITIGSVAKEVGVSAAALSVRFKETTQQTPGEYLRNIRLERVREELLRNGASERSLTDIASSLGFSHYGHFARNYHERYGERPRDTAREAQLNKSRRR